MSAISEIDIRDWQRAEKIVEALPVSEGDTFSNLPSYADWEFLMKLIEKQLDGAPQVAALFKRPHKYVNEAEKLTPYPIMRKAPDESVWLARDDSEFYEEFSPYNGM